MVELDKLHYLYSAFVKITTASVIYSFISTLHWDDGIWSNVVFIVLYILERIFAFCTIKFELRLLKVDLGIVAVLIPFHFEEFFLLLRGSAYPKYLQGGIIGQALLISIGNLPIHCMTIYRALTISPPQACSLLAGFLSLSSFFLLNLVFFYLFLFEKAEDPFSIFRGNSPNIHKHIRELCISSLHFYSYIGLLWINSSFLTNFWAFFTTIFIILITISFSRIYKKFNLHYPDDIFKKLFLYAGFFFKQLLQIDFDQRQLKENQLYLPSMDLYGKYLFDEMLGFSLRLKACLLTILLAGIVGFQIETQCKIITVLILALSVISLRIYASRCQKYTADPPKIIEVFSFLELKCLLNQYYNSSKSTKDKEYWDNVKIIASKIQDYNPFEIEEFPSILLNAFNGVDVFLNENNFRKSIHSNTSEQSNQQVVKLQRSNIEQLDQIIAALRENKLVNGIKVIKLYLYKINESYYLIQELLNHRINVQLSLNSQDMHIQHYNDYVDKVHCKIINQVAFSKVILPYLLYSPALIYYDLHEDIIHV